MASLNAGIELETQLRKQRRKVDFDTFDVMVQQLLSMLLSDAIDIAPVYQRQFRWDPVRCSQLIESLFLGIPIPSLFMATNRDGTWELVDGVQRLNTLAMFAGGEDLRKKLGIASPLRLNGLEKLTNFDNFTFADLPKTLQLQFETRPLKVVTLSDKSDKIVRFDLFERLNTGGIALTNQEIRDCVFRGKFSNFLEKLALDENFCRMVILTDRRSRDGTREECVLRFFAFLNNYQNFLHLVKEFLNDYMQASSKSFDYEEGEDIFRRTFKQLAIKTPDGIMRPNKKGKTPLVLYEAIAVGAALAIRIEGKLDGGEVSEWIGSSSMKEYTSGATNNRPAVLGRIEYCRDKFLGK